MEYFKRLSLSIAIIASLALAGCSEHTSNSDEDDGVILEPVECTKSITWDFSDSSIIVEQEGSDSSITAITLRYEDKDYRFECSNTRYDNGNLIIDEGGEITLLTEMGRVGTICIVFNQDYGVNYVEVTCGYSLDRLSELDSKEQILWGDGIWYDTEGEGCDQELRGLPNFFDIKNAGGTLAIEKITLGYEGVTTELVSAELDTDFYGFLLEGDKYNPEDEIFSEEDGNYKFYLWVSPDSPYIVNDSANPYGMIDGIPDSKFVTGDIIRADGTRKAQTDDLEVGDAIEVTAGAYTFIVDLPVRSLFKANNLKELMPYNNANSTGELNVLVVPMYFEDQTDCATEQYKHTLYSCLGRVIDENGSITDYTGDDVDYSFTEYFDLASYNKLKLNCFVTDFYGLEGTYEDNRYLYMPTEVDILDSIQQWVNDNYSGMLDKLDQDKDGIYDAVVFLNALGYDIKDCGYYTLSYQGAYNHTVSYYKDRAITTGDGAAINYFASINEYFFEGNGSQHTSGTLCHEFSHQLGLLDYYDVTYSGINAIGTYDMQSSNEGDWNVLSKFCAGWINPIVVDPTEIGDGLEIKINAFEADGSAILIPTEKTEISADGSVSPFSEYIIIDLYTPDGLYSKSFMNYDLYNPGVRIYHADARAVTIDLVSDSGEAYSIGTDMLYNSYTPSGKYYLELIQKSGVNTFTDFEMLYPYISQEDLFYAGDSFSMDTHNAFFTDGKMDDGSELNYTITVTSIENGTATIYITQ